MEIEENSIQFDNYRRIRVNMDITKPLCRHRNVKGKDGSIIQVDLAYE